MANAEKVSKQKSIGISSTRPAPNHAVLEFLSAQSTVLAEGGLADGVQALHGVPE